LQVQADSTPSQYVVTNTVVPGKGAMRPTARIGYAAPTTTYFRDLGPATEMATKVIAYTLDTRRARTEIRAQATQGSMLRRLVARLRTTRRRTTRSAHAFRLLVPVEMEMFLAVPRIWSSSLDPGTAGIPWELLDANVPGSARPASVGQSASKLIRNVATSGDFRRQVKDPARVGGLASSSSASRMSRHEKYLIPGCMRAHAPKRT
jgi:hypothetical protein